MITKILLTALIIIAVTVYFRHRTATRVPATASSKGPRPWFWRALPAALLFSALLVSAVLFWVQWQDEHRIFTARVIDTRNGQVTTYSVYRDDVHGRSFQTVDGRTVTLADVERLELVQSQD